MHPTDVDVEVVSCGFFVSQQTQPQESRLPKPFQFSAFTVRLFPFALQILHFHGMNVYRLHFKFSAVTVRLLLLTLEILSFYG